MIVEARNTATGESHYFNVNFAPKSGKPYQFMWFDGRRAVLELHPVPGAPPDAEVLIATFDVPSHEIFVQSGR